MDGKLVKGVLWIKKSSKFIAQSCCYSTQSCGEHCPHFYVDIQEKARFDQLKNTFVDDYWVSICMNRSFKFDTFSIK